MENIKISNYRKDNRTNQQFEQDIRYGNETEKKIMKQYKQKLEKQQDQEIMIVDYGCGNDGKLLSEEMVSTKADYLFNGEPLEVKFNNNMCTVFHIKESQLTSYIQQQASILWVNGYTTTTPEYILLKLEDLKTIQTHAELVSFSGWGGKKARKLYKDQFNWLLF